MKATDKYFPLVLLITLYKVVLTGWGCLWIKWESVTIQIKAIEQYFPVVMLIMLYKVLLTFESVDEILSVTIQVKATEQYFPVVLLNMLYKVVSQASSYNFSQMQIEENLWYFALWYSLLAKGLSKHFSA